MVAPCGCRVLLDTDGKNPTRMCGRVKPNFALTEAGNPALRGGPERIARRARHEKVSLQDLCRNRLRYVRYERLDSSTSRSSFRSPNMIPSTHSPWRRYAFLLTPSRTKPARSACRMARSLNP